MSDATPPADPHLRDLLITGFRGIKHLALPQLGRVTLLTGQNGVGKTTVLEAVRIYAARGRSSILNSVLTQRDEFSLAATNEPDPDLAPELEALFFGRRADFGQSLTIGPEGTGSQLRIEVSSFSALADDQLPLYAGIEPNHDTRMLKIVSEGIELFLPWTITSSDYTIRQARTPRPTGIYWRRLEEDWPAAIGCESLGPGMLANRQLAALWDAVALTADEIRATKALRLIRGNGIEGIAVVGSELSRSRRSPRVIVKLAGNPGPVPLRSLGDGATRMLGVALALANSRNGFLVIDEAENGIHHSVQEDYWRMILETAHRHNVQVFATTHSVDCVRGFAQAASALPNIEGRLVRIDRIGDKVRAVNYSEEDLEVAANLGIEVR